MDTKVKKNESTNLNELRKGPWTLEEDTILVNYITTHGEGHWNTAASSAGMYIYIIYIYIFFLTLLFLANILNKYIGLKRSGKSCRLRWLNYLRPDVRRGNITLQEQILILELHSRWGNR